MRRLALVLLLFLSGCGTLQVRVDILDPTYVDTVAQQTQLRGELTAAIGQGPEQLRQSIEELERRHRQAYADLANAYTTLADQTSDSELGGDLRGFAIDLRQLFDNPEESIVQQYRQFEQDMLDLNAKIQSMVAASPPKPDEAITGELGTLLQQRLAQQNHFQSLINRNIREIAMNINRLGATVDQHAAGTSAAPVVPEQETQNLIASVDVLRSLTGGQTLTESPFAYAVASAPEERWKNSFNQAFGQGIFGNVDVAIKLESLGDFTVKGLTFDPSGVAEMASKAATQALLIAAQVSGVPVGALAGGGTTTAPGAALAASGGQLAEIEAGMDARNAGIEDQKAALRDIAKVILSERPILETDTPAALDRARQAIRASYAANATRLNLSALQ